MFPYFRLYIAFLAFFMGLTQVLAQDPTLELLQELNPDVKITKAQKAALSRELKIQQIFIKGIKEIELSGGEFRNIEKAVSTTQEMLNSSFHLYSGQAAIKRIPSDRSAIKEVLQKLKSFTYNQVANQGTMMSSAARRWGFGVGLAYILGAQVGTTYPLIMMSMGHLEYAGLLAAPVTTLSTGGYVAVKSAVKFRHLVKNMGGFGGYIEQKKILAAVKRFFGTSIFPAHDIIDFQAIGKSYAITIERSSVAAKIKRAFGYNSGVRARELYSFLEAQELLTPTLRKLSSSSLDSQTKLIAMIRAIELQSDTHTIAKLKAAFGSYINEISSLPNMEAARIWVAQASSPSSFEELGRLMMNIPDDIPPRIFDQLWRKEILPGATKTIGPLFGKTDFKTFRNLFNGWDETRKTFVQSVETSLHGDWKSTLAEYFFSASANSGTCGAMFSRRGDYAPLL